MNGRKGNFMVFDGDANDLDPSVEAALQEGHIRSEEKKLPPDQRQRRARERAKIRARRERRVTYDLPMALRRRIAEIAKELGIPASQLAAWLLSRELERLGGDKDERLEQLSVFMTPSSSPRYDWNLLLEPVEPWNL